MTNLHANTATLLAIVVAIALVGCGKVTPPPEDVVDVGLAVEQQPSLRERCIQKQEARLETCASVAEEEQHKCVAAADALMEACSDLPGEVLIAGDSGNTGLCEGECETVKCTVANPCNLDKDVDGDGTDDTCVTGERCAPAIEGDVCDEGIIFDCYCATFYYPKNIIRPLDECRCFCD